MDFKIRVTHGIIILKNYIHTINNTPVSYTHLDVYKRQA